MKFSNFYEQLFDKFDTPKSSKLAIISSVKFRLKKPYLSQHWMDSDK